MAINIKSDYLLSDTELENHFKVYAGPGAGKTHFIVSNIKNIIKSTDKIKTYKHKKIACITYTNSAVEELKSRLSNYDEYANISTIHSFLYENIISVFYPEIYNIIKEDFGFDIKLRKKPKAQIEGLGLLHDVDRDSIYSFIREKNSNTFDYSFSKKSMSEIQIDIDHFLLKNEILIKHSSKINEVDALAIKEYILGNIHILSHDEILYYSYRILERSEKAKYFIRLKYPYIFVDEFQDTSPLQVSILKLLGNDQCKIGIIGDFAQSIYSFQGAKPHFFLEFNNINDEELSIFYISGNRRSTTKIVDFCNYLREQDSLKQVSIKMYETEAMKLQLDNERITFLVGESVNINSIIYKIVDNGGIVITRSWASAIKFMKNVSDEQKTLFISIYNSYFNSPIDIRKEIEEINNVQWVRAFRFIIDLYETYANKSINNLLNSLKKFYASFKVEELISMTPKSISKFFKILSTLFSDTNSSIVSMIEQLNKFMLIETDIFLDKQTENIKIEWKSEYDSEKVIENLSKIRFSTAFMLFNEVFAKNGKYITVHQAKGLEWDSVVVSFQPTKFDGTNLIDTLLKPKILAENSIEEFTRMFYVASSRAKLKLYVHINHDIVDKVKQIENDKGFEFEYIE